MTDHRQTTRADEPDWRRPREAGDAPPPGWDPLDEPGWAPPPPPRRPGVPDLSPLFVLLDAVMRAVPRELNDQFRSLVREVLLTLRALIDWYLERLEGRPREPRVEDIPID